MNTVHIDLSTYSGITYSVIDDPGADLETACEVPATSEDVVRWQAAARAWKQAQEEMQARYAESAAIEAAVEAIADELASEEYEKDAQERRHAALVREGLADQIDGPREWLLCARTRANGSVRGYTVHHSSCGVPKSRPEPVRIPTVARVVAEGLRGPEWQRNPVKVCRCAAKRLVDEPSVAAALAEKTRG